MNQLNTQDRLNTLSEAQLLKIFDLCFGDLQECRDVGALSDEEEALYQQFAVMAAELGGAA